MARTFELEIPLYCPDNFYKLFVERAYLLPDFCPSIVHRIDLADGNRSWVDQVGSCKWISFKSSTDRINSLAAIKDVVTERNDEERKIAFKVLEGTIMETYETFEVTLHVTGGIAKWTIRYVGRNQGAAKIPLSYGRLLIEVSIAVDNHLVSPRATNN